MFECLLIRSVWWPAELLQRCLQEYWDTAPAYGGDRVIWDALKAACSNDPETAALILQAASIQHNPDLSECYDERGEGPRLWCAHSVRLQVQALMG